MLHKYMCHSCGGQFLVHLEEETNAIEQDFKEKLYCPKCGEQESQWIAGPGEDDDNQLGNLKDTCLYPEPINNSNAETFNMLKRFNLIPTK